MARMLSVDTGAESLNNSSGGNGRSGGSNAEPSRRNQPTGSGGSRGYESLESQPAQLQNGSTRHKLDTMLIEPGTCRWMGLGLFFIFYLILGASVFSAIESPIEQKAMEQLYQERLKFMKENKCVSDASLNELIRSVVSANNRGVSMPSPSSVNGDGNAAVTPPPSWSFGQSFFFASTVVTTIGYGHQSPLSTSGKVFCILYAMIGIPLTLLLLTATVDRMLVPVNSLLGWLNTQLGHIHTPFFIRLLHLFLVVIVVGCVMFLVPAAIFTALEPEWRFTDSIYYCFISLTTIGLGDFIPGDTPGQHLRPLYKAITTVYLLVGVTVMMMTLSLFYAIPEFDIAGLFLLTGCSSNNSGAAQTMSMPGARPLPRMGQTPVDTSGLGSSRGPDPERIRLQTTGMAGPRYTQQLDEDSISMGGAGPVPSTSGLNTRRVIRARSRPDDDTPDDEQPSCSSTYYTH